MSKMLMKGFGLSAATLALVLTGYVAQAQEKKVEAPKAAAVKKAPACKTVKAQAGCEVRTDCQWVGESKDDKGKVKAKAYCRAKPAAPAVKADPKKK